MFCGENSGSFAALDARSGELLWHVPINEEWRASPMTAWSATGSTVATASRLGLWSFAAAE